MIGATLAGSLDAGRSRGTWGRASPWILAVLVFLVVGLIATVLVGASERQRLRALRADVGHLASVHADMLHRSLEHELLAAHAVAALVRQARGDPKDFETFAQALLHFHPGLVALHLAPDGVVRQIVPREGNESVIGLDLLADPERAPEVRLALETRQLTLAGPYDLLRGGRGVVGRLAVYLDTPEGRERFWGVVSVTVRFPEALEPGRLSQLADQGFRYVLWRAKPGTGASEVIVASPDPPVTPLVCPLSVPNAAWFLGVSPRQGWGDPVGLSLKIALGLLFSLLLASLTKLLVESWSRASDLESQVTERTAEILARESDLRRAEAVAGIGSWVYDIARGTVRASPQAFRISGLSQARPFEIARFLGHVHPADRASVENAWRGALGGLGYEIQHRLSSDGRICWVRHLAELEWNEDGTPSRVIVTLQDVTQRIAMDRELRIAATVFEAQEGMLVTDANNVILRVNHAFCLTTGYRPEEVVGKTPRLFRSGRHDKAFYEAMWDCIERTGGWQGEVWNRRKNGEIYPEWLTITAVKDSEGAITHFVGTHTDITQRKAAEREILHLAYYDPLTQLPNRRLLMDRLHQNLANSARHRQQGALLFIDLDNFKILNDTQGHEVGDRLLQQVARRLSECVREGDTVARLGGDEFVVMLQGLGLSGDDAANLARIVGEKILTSLNRPYQLGGLTHSSTPSIGVVLFGGGGESIDELLRRADLAMYQAKAAGRNRLCFFDPAMQSALSARANLEGDLRRGLATGQLALHYQPQVDDQGRLIGAEALVRWPHPQHGWISPGEILNLAETTGQILSLTLWTLESVCAQLGVWAGQPETACLRLALNISPAQFRHPGFLDAVRGALERHGVSPGRLTLEVTEALALEDPEEIAARMRVLKTRGVRFSLDNLGASACSLTVLQQLPLDEIKVDPLFVRHILEHPNGEAIARAFMDLARGLGLEILAEGVETQEQHDFLIRQGCQGFQGYLIGHPGPSEALGEA